MLIGIFIGIFITIILLMCLGCCNHNIETIIPGRPHINALSGEICGRDADITKKVCSLCGDTRFINIMGSQRDRQKRAKEFREVRSGKRKYYHTTET